MADDRRQPSGEFVLEVDTATAFRLLNAPRLIENSNNLGDTRRLLTHPATTTHQRPKPEARAELGIRDGMVRLSVGLDAFEDIAADIEAGMTAARGR